MTGYTNLYLYKNTKFYKHQNYKIDEINSFLATLQLDKLTFEQLQYFRPDSMTKEIKIQFNQKGIKSLHQYNYARVEIYNTDGTIEWELFYFVDKVEWLSMDCIKLHMTLDTLNSFLDTLEFHPRTFIEREHCDRWNYDAYYLDSSSSSIDILRAIPELNEGLNPQKYAYYMTDDTISVGVPKYDFYISNGKNAMKIYDSFNLYGDSNWLLAYLTERGGTEEEPTITRQVISYPLDYQFYIKIGENAVQTTKGQDLNIESNDNQKILVIPYSLEDALRDAYWKYDDEHPFEYIGGGHTRPISHKYTNTEHTSKGVGYPYIDSLSTNAPNETTISIYTANNYIRLIQTMRTWKNVCKSLFVCSFVYTPLLDAIIDNGFFRNLSNRKNNRYSNESALYSSEFFNITFSYGDCSYTIALEDYKWTNEKTMEEILDDEFTDNPFIIITFGISYLIDSNVYFRFGIDSNVNAFSVDRKQENGDLMIVPLSSQVPLLSDGFLEYLRSGYNYDIKIRDVNREQRQNEYQHQQTQFATGFMRKILNPMGWIPSIIQGDELDRYQHQSETLTRMQEDLQMEKNIAQMKGAKIGIEQINGGIDKYNVLSRGKLSYAFMLPRKSWWKYLEDYFYFYGNKVQYYGVPTHNNRCLFDYLKCRAEFINRNNVPNNEALQDIIARLGNGITFIHKYLNQWTFDSDYKENVENRLLEIIQGE